MLNTRLCVCVDPSAFRVFLDLPRCIGARRSVQGLRSPRLVLRLAMLGVRQWRTTTSDETPTHSHCEEVNGKASSTLKQGCEARCKAQSASCGAYREEELRPPLGFLGAWVGLT